ncbi:MAG: H-NS histone family protein [Cardiobacteriaceae bacterium]|nr:H-NS histone family protein [Cardiobacteriaceae bacterium]
MTDLNNLIKTCINLDTEEFVQLINALEGERQKRASELRRTAEKKAKMLLTSGKGEGKFLATKSSRKRVVKPKYRHPETGETWTGCGSHPKWVRTYLEEGGTLEQILINK